MTEPTTTRRTGSAAVAAGALLFASVAAELVRPVQQPDGTVTDRAGFALYLGGWVLGAAALVVALSGLRCLGPLPRPGRIGGRICLTGAALLLAFGVVALATGLAGGSPLEASFLLFALGLLLLGIGAVPLALGLRRTGTLGGWWPAVLGVTAGALVALGTAADPWHDLGLFLFFAAWVGLGVGLLRVASAPPSARTGHVAGAGRIPGHP